MKHNLLIWNILNKSFHSNQNKYSKENWKSSKKLFNNLRQFSNFQSKQNEINFRIEASNMKCHRRRTAQRNIKLFLSTCLQTKLIPIPITIITIVQGTIILIRDILSVKRISLAVLIIPSSIQIIMNSICHHRFRRLLNLSSLTCFDDSFRVWTFSL